MQLSTSSSILSLITNFKPEYILIPWKITVDMELETITVEQRNWYLIGRDSNTIAFRFIREVIINEHLFGADIIIKVAWYSVTAFYISKSKTKRIKQLLINYNQNKNSKIKFT